MGIQTQKMMTLLQLDQEELRSELRSAIREEFSEVLRSFKIETPAAPKPDRITDIHEVASLTGLGLSKIYKMTSTGELPCARYGPRRLVFSRKVLEAWMEERTRPMGESLDAITSTARKRSNRRS